MVCPEKTARRAAGGTVPLRLLAALLAFGLVTKVARLGDPPGYYLDEVYHAFTAREYLHGHPQAYDPWAKPPPGVAYEWTHPPLAKLLMAGSMALLGENAVGWRLGSALAGTAATGVAALLGLELFASPAVAVITAALLGVEGLFFVQSRVAMNDAYFVLFALSSVLAYVRWRRSGRAATLAAAGLALGLAAATKWTALYVLAIFGVDRLATWARALARERRWPRPSEPALLALLLLALPAAIYVASYAQFFLQGKGPRDLWALQQQMWWYHTGLKATHPYQSRPWQWLLDLRPVWMYARQVEGGRVANIYNLGNPVVLVGGLVAAAAAMVEWRMDWPRAFALLCWLMLWLPWTLSPRIMLFYHYVPAVPFLCILLARALARAWEGGRRRAVGAFLGVALAWFAFTYPHLSALPLPARFVDRAYYLVPSWR